MATPMRYYSKEHFRRPEAELLPLLRDLGIGFVPYSPLGHGFLTGAIRSVADFTDDDWRKTNPRFTRENFQRNLRIVDEVETIAPIPGTRRLARMEENTAADRTEVSADQLEQLNTLTPAAGARHDEANMAIIDN